MRVRLRDLKVGKWCRAHVDPVDKEAVDKIRKAIRQNGGQLYQKTGAIVVRRVGNDIEIVVGRHRVAAAIAEGIEYLDLEVSELSDAEAILKSAHENSSQRGLGSTAGLGTIASALWLIAGAVMRGDLSPIGDMSINARAFESLQGNVVSEKGLGAPILEQFLKDVPGITSKHIEDFFATVKKCGEYAGIIADIKKDIDAEQKEEIRKAEVARKAAAVADEARARAAKAATEAAERAKATEAARVKAATKAKADRENAEKQRAADAAMKAAERAKEQNAKAAREAAEAKTEAAKTEQASAVFEETRKVADVAQGALNAANKRPITRDPRVAEVFKNPTQLRDFYNIVERDPIKDLLHPYTKQYGLAQQLVKDAAEQGRDLTSLFIRERIGVLVQGLHTEDNKAKRDELKQMDFVRLQRVYTDDVRARVRGLMYSLLKLVELCEANKDREVVFAAGLTHDVEAIKRIIDRLEAFLHGKATAASVVKLIEQRKAA